MLVKILGSMDGCGTTARGWLVCVLCVLCTVVVVFLWWVRVRCSATGEDKKSTIDAGTWEGLENSSGATREDK